MAEDCTGTGAYLEVKYKCEKPKPKKKAPKKTAPKKTSPKKTTKKHQKTGDDDDDDDAAAKAKADADAKAKEEQDKAEADAKAAEDARKAQEEADKKDAEEADRKAKENAERKAKEEAERLAQEAADKAKADADSKAKLEKDYETTVNSGPARQWENMLRQVLATNREIKVMEREKREALDKLRGFMAVFQKPAIEVKFGPLIMAAQMRLKQMDAALGVATGALQTYIGSLDKELQDRVREWMSRQQDRMKQEMAG
ncbi:hypothetical protein DFJ74DRAFT_658705 [Hyaloraphidium curvatum]|nr:hypothetical protein DFJ74DRAFT_658705 [Hyaloraphidium curvatum]